MENGDPQTIRSGSISHSEATVAKANLSTSHQHHHSRSQEQSLLTYKRHSTPGRPLRPPCVKTPNLVQANPPLASHAIVSTKPRPSFRQMKSHRSSPINFAQKRTRSRTRAGSPRQFTHMSRGAGRILQALPAKRENPFSMDK
jgi:hypothetical protein